MKSVGYLTNTKEGLEGEPGSFYNYILAKNGVFVRAEGSLLRATVRIGEADVRGLLPLEEDIFMPKGKMSLYYWELATSILVLDRHREQYLAVTWDGMYHLKYPMQEGSGGSVSYEHLPNTLLDIHSHGTMHAYFSLIDDKDEQGLGLYMVVGELDTFWPQFQLRVGVYGYFAPVNFNEVFGV